MRAGCRSAIGAPRSAGGDGAGAAPARIRATRGCPAEADARLGRCSSRRCSRRRCSRRRCSRRRCSSRRCETTRVVSGSWVGVDISRMWFAPAALSASAVGGGLAGSGVGGAGAGSGVVAGACSGVGAGWAAAGGGAGTAGALGGAGGAAGAGGGLGALRDGSKPSGSTYVSLSPTRIPRWTYGTACSASPDGPGSAMGSPSATDAPFRTRSEPRCVSEAL